MLATSGSVTGSDREWIAERTLRVGKGRGRVLVRLEKPRKVSEEEWICRVEIHRGKTRMIMDHDIHGADSFQALIIALRAIRYELDKLPGLITWEDQAPGDVGFPLYVTDVFGFKLQRRLESMVESETQHYADEMTRRIQRIERARDATEKKAAKRDFASLLRNGGTPRRRGK